MSRSLISNSLRRWLRRTLSGKRPGDGSFDLEKYWESRYAAGGTSGEGSYGRLAAFKADQINEFVAETGSSTVIEFGCGDGNQLSLLRVPRYMGLDISRTAVRRCISRFAADNAKSFFLFDAKCYRDNWPAFRADIALSLDVIFHLVDDNDFVDYLEIVCASCEKYLILYTTDYDSKPGGHQRHRAVSKYMSSKPEFELMRKIPNPFPGSADGENQSDAVFLMYKRIGAQESDATSS